MNFNKEQEFKMAFKKEAEKRGYKCVLLESHHTELGIPDMLLVGEKGIRFIEFKNGKGWRYEPGQLAFIQQVLRASKNKVRPLTLINLPDKIVLRCYDLDFENYYFEMTHYWDNMTTLFDFFEEMFL